MKKLVLILVLLIRIAYAKPSSSFDADIQPAVFSVTLVMIHDVVDPPLASRYYSYCMLGADAIVAKFNKEMAYPSSYIKSFPAIRIKENSKTFNYQIAPVSICRNRYLPVLIQSQQYSSNVHPATFF